jgi:hypothetical protein
MVFPDSNRVSRVPLYSGVTRGLADFDYGAITLFGRTFQSFRLPVSCPLQPLPSLMHDPTTPHVQRRQACIHMVWAPPRSLATTSGISVLISFPEGTEMFQFPSFATQSLCIQLRVTWTLLHVGFPIRTFADQCLLTTPRNFSQFCHVLLRLLVPRHPPNALNSLTTITFANLLRMEGTAAVRGNVVSGALPTSSHT